MANKQTTSMKFMMAILLCFGLASQTLSSFAQTSPASTPTTPAATSQPSAAAPAATATPAASASSAAKAVAVKDDNPYGFKAMIQHGDTVSKIVLALLLVMSIGTWYLLATKYLEQGKVLKEAANLGDSGKFWSASSLAQGAQGLEAEGAFRYMADTAVKSSQKHEGLLANVDLGSWMESTLADASDEVEHRLQKGLSFLATVASTSPFVGLFGTVWGILNALTAIGVAGQASIDKVAGPVGEALIMTAIGLAVAVPAAIGYNWLVGRNTSAMHYVNGFGSKLRAAVLGSSKAK